MSSAVTIAVPVYKRLKYLAGALECVAAQDYPNIELLISDNGQNGPELQEIIDLHCQRPYRLRRNPETVGIRDHFNQLVEEATGEYFVLLQDDDEISPNFVSSLVSACERNSDVGVALARVEVMDEVGRTVPSKRDQPLPPELMSGEAFVQKWCRHEYDFVCHATNLARTREIAESGGYPDLSKGTSIDDALVLKLGLGRQVAFIADVAFRYRVYESSHGLALDYRELARDLRQFIEWLDSDPVMREYARQHPQQWAGVRSLLVELTWRTYRHRWKTMYRKRLSPAGWIRAAFAMPFIPAYYSAVTSHIVRRGLSASKRLLLGGFRH